MHQIELRALDLNLLVVLDALLLHGGVTAAAQQLGMSPSATSHALSRLRVTFDDPLLLREGNGMVPTPRAVALRGDLVRLLADARRLLSAEPAFDPLRSGRTFCMAASDVLGALLGRLVAAIRSDAPGVGLQFVPQVVDASSLSHGPVDLALLPLALAPAGCTARSLGTLDFVVVARRGHPFLAESTPEAWQQSAHVVVATGRPGPGFVGSAALRAGWRRTVALSVPGFLPALHAVACTEMLFTAPRALVAPVCESLGLGMVPAPMDLPEVRVGAVWHPRFDADVAHRWLRSRVVEALTPALC